jgi:surfeit locus 1 family protein
VSLSTAHFGWRPSGIGTALVVVLLPTFMALGFWQLQRADSKRAQFAQFDSQADLPVLIGLPDDDVPRYARVRLSGEFLPGQQFLLDNMTSNGRSGYHVLTPFEPSGDSRLILVNRGWVPASGDRQLLPAVAVAAGDRVVSGQLDLLPRPGLALGSPAQSGDSGWPRVVFFPEMGALATLLGRDLFQYQLLLDGAQADGFVRTWGPRSMAPEQHVGYAVQWFAFALVLIIIYVAMSLRRSAR